MPRGRPLGSKNKTTLQKESLFEQPTKISEKQPYSIQTPEIKNNKNLDKYPKCMLCGTPMISNIHSVQLTSFTGRAYWHRSIPDCIRMCRDCAAQFSDMVENWLIKHGAPMRLGYKEEENNEQGYN